jgi:hypothetical protein
VVGIAILLVLAGSALAVVIPSLASTTDVVAVIVIAVMVLGFVIWLMFRGASGWKGGWPRGGSRMG